MAKKYDGGIFSARDMGELYQQVKVLSEEGYRIITVIDTQNGMYHVVAQKKIEDDVLVVRGYNDPL